MSRALPAEVTLAAACCHWPASGEGTARVRAAAGRVQDWVRFDAVVRRNRVTPLVHHALVRAEIALPPELAADLAQRSRGAARRALLMARESLRLQEAFAAGDIPFMIVKGTPLAILAYGELGIKEAADIDFLVAQHDAVAARRLLMSLGYELSIGSLDDAEFERYVEHGKEAVFYNPQKTITAELHWRLIDHRRLLKGVDVRGPAQSIAIPGSGLLRTLADEPLFAFLCLHGAQHNWTRLKWLADVNAFVSVRSEAELERLLGAARAYGASRSASLALRLCGRLFGLSLSEQIAASLEHSGVTRALETNVIAGLAYRGGGGEHEAYSAPWLREKTSQFFLARGAAHAIDQARALWISPTDRAHIALPRRLSFLYHLLRVPLWLGRIGRGVLDRKRA